MTKLNVWERVSLVLLSSLKSHLMIMISALKTLVLKRYPLKRLAMTGNIIYSQHFQPNVVSAVLTIKEI
jgi:hypothetical protein